MHRESTMSATSEEPGTTKNQHRSGGNPKRLNRDHAKQKRQATRDWLERILPTGNIADERVKELVPYLDKFAPGSSYLRIAEAMIRNNEIPRVIDVKRRHDSRREARNRRGTRIGVPVDLTVEVRSIVRDLVSQSWATKDRGPSWSEVRRRMGWSYWEANEAIIRLSNERFLKSTREEGSLALDLASETSG